MATDATLALTADVMRYVASHGEIQGLSHRRAPLDEKAPMEAVSDLRYVNDVTIEEPDNNGYGFTPPARLVNESYVEVTVRNNREQVYVKRLMGSFDEILFEVLTAGGVVDEVPFEG